MMEHSRDTDQKEDRHQFCTWIQPLQKTRPACERLGKDLILEGFGDRMQSLFQETAFRRTPSCRLGHRRWYFLLKP